jgi:hypothetical protein
MLGCTQKEMQPYDPVNRGLCSFFGIGGPIACAMFLIIVIYLPQYESVYDGTISESPQVRSERCILWAQRLRVNSPDKLS